MPNRNPTVVYPPGAPRRSPRLVNNSNTTTPKPKSTNDVEVSEFDEGVVVEGGRKRRRKHGGDGIKEGGKKQRVEGGVEGKRKHDGGGKIGGVEGKRKHVSKLVPGKSKHDCFDKVHHDFHTPPQCQPRSRAKAINSSPLHENNNPTKPKPKSTNKSSTRSRPKTVRVRKSHNLTDEVPSLRRSPRFSKKNGRGEGGKKQQVEGGVEGKRKHDGGGKIGGVEGKRKHVSKLVPGKSKHDCFDKVHHDFHTPPQCQPRSRAKAINSSPLHENNNPTKPKPKSTNKSSTRSRPKTVRVRKSHNLTDEVPSLRRSPRFSKKNGRGEGGKKQQVEGGVEGKRKHDGGGKIGGVEGKRKHVSKLVPGKSKHDCFDKVHHDFHTPPQCQPRSRAKAINSSPLHENNNPTKPKPKSTNKSSTRSRPNLSDEVPEGKRKHGGGGEIVEKLRKQEVECGGKRKRKRGGDGIEKGGKKEEIEGGVEGKRKRKRGGGEVVEGWTKEQELALWAAYFTAKPSPHFWKNVSKEVPGKSKQDCFDRVHLDFHTPPQCQPRSRAKAINSSLHSISASKLLIPSGKKVDKSNILKPKSISTQKSIENLLQRHLKVDQNHKGDIFHLLEPNIDFSTNAILPIQELCTPKQQMENQGFLQSSSIHKKSLSRFSGSSGVKDLASPPVLKQVKNKVQHEKYVNQLRFRDVMRRATSIRAKKSVAGEGKGIQKTDVVKAAKVALLSQARDAINKFQQSQINFMGDNCSDIGVEDESP